MQSHPGSLQRSSPLLGIYLHTVSQYEYRPGSGLDPPYGQDPARFPIRYKDVLRRCRSAPIDLTVVAGASR
eukprot:2015484-Pyramimonas_sp.AAC.1